MKPPALTVIDFETRGIEGRPNYPPEPVSFSIQEPGMRAPKFWSWGHPIGNNTTKREAQRILKTVWKPSNDLLFHNAKFDVDVAEQHMGMPRHPALKTHDSSFMLFLRDPHCKDLSLKPAAERYLGAPPQERDAVQAWVMANKKALEAEYGRFTPSEWGKHISHVPAHIVGPYANGDVKRTKDLFLYCWDYVVNDYGMHEAYQREQKVMPIFLDNETVGIRLDVKKLRTDVVAYQAALEATDAWLRKRLKSPGLSMDNDMNMLEALLRNKIVLESDLALTATGKFSISKKTLTPELYRDPRVAQAFGYRNRLSTCLKMFMVPWLAQAEARGDGYISTNWNQVRGEGGGTRTGRPSTSNPNFLNISKTWDNNDDGYVHPEFMSVLALPLVRKYLLPDAGETWLHRDYNGQELRLLAHFEDGPLLQAYRDNPWLDVHDYVRVLIEEKVGKVFVRKNVKIANFRIIYGGGAPATANGIGCSIEEAKDLLDAHGKALPSIKGKGGLSELTKKMGRAGEPIYTWGGRAYFVEPPGYSKVYKRHMTYEYKLLNYLCQGSAAETTKQAMINYNEHPKRQGRFLAQVYDEINVSGGPTPKLEMAVLRESMECVSKDLDVPMLSEGKTGLSWGDLKKFAEGKSDYE